MQDYPSRDKNPDTKSHRSLLERLTAFISPEPENRSELLEMLHDAHERKLIDADALSMIEGVFQVADLSASDIMIPRSQMTVIDISKPIVEWMPMVLESAHSRFPAIDGERDKVVGILLAKDFLGYFAGQPFDVQRILRPAMFIPESKRLNVLLREFRINRNHLAVVVDEYGGVSGIVTIEDVLEQIVGNIEDEFDEVMPQDDIVRLSDEGPNTRWQVNALTSLEDFNTALDCNFPDDDVDTVGGLVADHLNHIPRIGEVLELDGVRFEVLGADERQVHALLVEKLPAPADEEAG